MGGGQVEFRAEKNGVVHACIGKIDFTEEMLAENFRDLMVGDTIV